MATAPAFPIPAVWLRLPAFAVDLLLLYLLGWLLCRIPGVAFDQLGALARVAGFTAACLYFALTEALTGCSPGQRLLGLRCVSADGVPYVPDSLFYGHAYSACRGFVPVFSYLYRAMHSLRV